MKTDYTEKKAAYREAIRERGMKLGKLQEVYIIFMNLIMTTESEKEMESLLNELFLIDEFARRGNYSQYVVQRNLSYFEIHANSKKELRDQTKALRNYFVRALKEDLTSNQAILTPREAYICFYLYAWLTSTEKANSLTTNFIPKKLVLESTKSYFRKWDRSIELEKFNSLGWKTRFA